MVGVLYPPEELCPTMPFRYSMLFMVLMGRARMRNDYIVGKGDVIFMLQYLMKLFFIIRPLFFPSDV